MARSGVAGTGLAARYRRSEHVRRGIEASPRTRTDPGAPVPGPCEQIPSGGTPAMMPIALARQDIEILLDSPNQRDYVVSAYADMTVQNGFQRHMQRHLENEARAA